MCGNDEQQSATWSYVSPEAAGLFGRQQCSKVRDAKWPNAAPRDGPWQASYVFGAGMIRTITIEREYGCGAVQIAEKLADRLGWKLWDQELTQEIARLLPSRPVWGAPRE